jgi:hypothetical protein
MTYVNNDRDTPHSRNVACCFAKTLYTSTDVSQHFGQLPFEKGKAQTAPHLTLCQFMRHRFGQGVYFFQGNRVLKKSIEAKSVEDCPTDCTQSQARSK